MIVGRGDSALAVSPTGYRFLSSFTPNAFGSARAQSAASAPKANTWMLGCACVPAEPAKEERMR